MKLLIQFISQTSGQRSQVIEMTREQLAEEILHTLHQAKDEPERQKKLEDDYILILMEKPDGDAEEFSFSQAPLLNAKLLVDFVLTIDKQAQLIAEWEQLEKIQETIDNV